MENKNCRICGNKLIIGKNTTKIRTKNWINLCSKCNSLSSLYFYQVLRERTIQILGGKCIKCGFSNIKALQIDHINGGGNKDLNRTSSSGYLHKVIRSFKNKENKYQLLCANCNQIKKVENNECKKKR